jgi:hypothetical protein
MAQELGHMPKPEAETYASTRKLYLVPMVFAPPDQPAEFMELHDRYWKGVQEHVNHLASRLGGIHHIYIEMMSGVGDDAVKAVEAMNPTMARVVQSFIVAGGQMVATEDEQIVREAFDWQRCLMIGLASEKVSRLARDSYTDAVRSRYSHIGKKIETTLQAGETGVLIIGEGHSVQFPSDIQVFYVAPPALDEIHRWLRDRASATKESPEDTNTD